MSHFSPLTPHSFRDRYDPREVRRRFANRQRELDEFEKALGAPPPVPVLTFFGVGGSGKTFLMSFLRYKYGSSEDGPNASHPLAYLNFRPGRTPPNPHDALWEARVQLRRSPWRIGLPRFDTVWAKQWERIHRTPIRKNQSLMQEDVVLLAEILQSVEALPAIGDALKALRFLGGMGQRLSDYLGHRAVLEWFKCNIEEPRGQGWKDAMASMAPAEFDDLLPRAFAADLASITGRGRSKRVVLLFDNCETIQEQLGITFNKEARGFVQALAECLADAEANALVVVAGRDRLRWGEVLRRGRWEIDVTSPWGLNARWEAPTLYVSLRLRQHGLDNLSAEDTQAYLRSVGLESSGETQSAWDYTLGYPLALGILTDILGAQDQQKTLAWTGLSERMSQYAPLSGEWCSALDEWLLDYLLEHLTSSRQDSLIRLLMAASVPRWFTRDLLGHIVGEISLSELFPRVVSLSAVNSSPGSTRDAYEVHSRLRSLLRERIAQDRMYSRKLEAAAMGWFESQAAATEGHAQWRYRIEALYHRWHIAPGAALKEFLEVFQQWHTSKPGLAWELIASASDAAQTLEPAIKARLKLSESLLHTQTLSDNMNPGENKAMSLRAAQEAADLARSAGDEALLAESFVAMGCALNDLQAFDEALAHFATACEIAEGCGASQPLAAALWHRATIESANNPDYCNLELLDRALAAAREVSNRRWELEMLYDRAWLAMRVERWPEVERALESAERINSVLRDTFWEASISQVWGESLALRRQWTKAIEHLETARREFDDLHDVKGSCAAKGWLGIALIMTGRADEGFALVCQALKEERSILGSREGASKWLHLLGESFIDCGEAGRALEALWLAEVLREELGHRELGKTRTLIDRSRAAIGEADYARLKREHVPRESEFAEFAFLWELGPFRRHEGNPILVPRGSSWESLNVFNPAAWADDKSVYLMYRAEGPASSSGQRASSSIGLAVSADGLHFQRESQPVIVPTEPFETPGGCEDPRVVRIDSTFYMTYTVFDGTVARLAMATSDDLRLWRKRGLMITDTQWDQTYGRKGLAGVPRGWSKSGAILSQPINGYYWMFFGDLHVWAAYSTDLMTWDVVEEPVFSPRTGFFDSKLVEPAAVAYR